MLIFQNDIPRIFACLNQKHGKTKKETTSVTGKR